VSLSLNIKGTRVKDQEASKYFSEIIFYQITNVNFVYYEHSGRVKTRVKHPDRAPKPEELAKVIDIADLRGKVIVSMMTLGGFREGTLARLRYHHIKEDYEAHRIPIHIPVEAEITKGNYHEYDIFIGQEAIQYLCAYLEVRQRGAKNIPPELIVDDSPLIRNANTKLASWQ
jgi:hypothetical protein